MPPSPGPQPLHQQRFAVVDVETSGLSTRWHHVLQVGVVVVDGDGTVLDRWSSLVAPRRRWWFRVGPTNIHGIRRRDVKRAPQGAEVFRELAQRLEGARFVAHNAPFDVAFLRKASRLHQVPLQIDEPLCTLRMSRALDPERLHSHRLADLCARYGIDLTRPHDALADADATAALLPHLLRAHHVERTDQLSALAALGTRPRPSA
ncbi:MAG TPA: exonuclease [Acidimicrobiaceae bacterium]|nr:exonuclease [Acidimicrobiaceae bacterium]